MSNLKGLIKILPTTIGHVAIDDSVPKCWFAWGNEIKIEPVPDTVYRLSLYVSDFPQTVLSADADEPDSIPKEFHECIVFFACYGILMKRKKWSLAEVYYNKYLSSLETKYRIYMDRKAEDRLLKHIPVRRKR